MVFVMGKKFYAGFKLFMQILANYAFRSTWEQEGLSLPHFFLVKQYNYKERLLLDQLMVTESGEKS